MKKLTLLLLLVSAMASAGSMTVTTDAATDARLQNWCFVYGPSNGIVVAATPGAVTAAQVKACVVSLVTAAVKNNELAPALNSVTVPAISQMN
jgi:hypothetical protein